MKRPLRLVASVSLAALAICSGDLFAIQNVWVCSSGDYYVCYIAGTRG